MKILHLLTSGNIGGIEVLCRDIGQNSKIENVFCFLFDRGLVYEQMRDLELSVYSFSEYRKLSYMRFIQIISIAIQCDAVIVHHNDPFLELYFLIIKFVLPSKKFISMIHHCNEPEIDKTQNGFVKLLLKRIIVKLMFNISDRLIFVSNAGYKSYEYDYNIPQPTAAIKLKT